MTRDSLRSERDVVEFQASAPRVVLPEKPMLVSAGLQIRGFVKMGKLRSPDRENTTEKRAQEEGVLEGFSA